MTSCRTKKICAEVGVSPSSDFRYTHGKNHGFGNVFIGMTGLGIQPTNYDYPGEPDLALFDQKMSTAPMSSPTYETFKAQTASFSILYQTMHKRCPNQGYYV